jgi:hypothetical protein
MNYAENPITDLANCIAHAQYVGFLDIEYETRDWEEYRKTKMDVRIPARRRPTTRDFGVYAMFPQTWGSTALGHGGMGGAAMTTAYTIVLECYHTQEFLVYFGGQVCYKVNRDSANFDIFIEDCKTHKLVSKRESSRYGN